MGNVKLFNEFPPISGKQWREKIDSDLKGADYEKKLVWKTLEGFSLDPYYRKEDLEGLNTRTQAGAFPFIRGTGAIKNDWLIRQDLKVCDQAEACNKKIISAIERGAQSLGLDLSGTETISTDFLALLLQNVDLNTTALHFTKASSCTALYESLISYAESIAVDPAILKGSLGADPIGKALLTGEFNPEVFSILKSLISTGAKTTPHFKIIPVNAGLFQDAGSSLAQELGFGLALAAEYINQLTDLGLEAKTICRSIAFSFACGPNYFMEIAKLRAARWLWSTVCAAYGIEAKDIGILIHSRSAAWNLTVYDHHVNILRTTTEAMSASLGGSNEISVLPFDKLIKGDGERSSRIARNIQIILKEESYLNQVGDPAAGSYYIETLTEKLADKAWQHFIETENEGGYLAAFKNEFIQKAVSESAEIKKQRVASRKDSILGVNQYPNFSEMILESVAENGQAEVKNTSYKRLNTFRASEEFEALRMETEARAKRPKVFLLKYGDPVWMTARAMFSGNFFACAGYEIINSSGFDNIETGIEAARAAEADIVVLCSSDDAYQEIGPKVYKALNSRAEIVIAGYPKDAIEALEEKGLKHFIHVRSNLLEELKGFQKNLIG